MCINSIGSQKKTNNITISNKLNHQYKSTFKMEIYLIRVINENIEKITVGWL